MARPRIGKHKICQHHHIVVEMKSTSMGPCDKLDKATILVDCFEVMKHQSEESAQLESAIDAITEAKEA